MPSAHDELAERFLQAIESSTNPTARFHIMNYGSEVYFRAFGYGPPPEKPGNSKKLLQDLSLPLNIYVDITTPKNPSIYYINYGQWTPWYKPDTIKPGQLTLPRARIRHLDLDLVYHPNRDIQLQDPDRKLDWYSRKHASQLQPWSNGGISLTTLKLNLDMSWLAAEFPPPNKPSSQFSFSYTATESPSPSKLFRYPSVTPSKTSDHEEIDSAPYIFGHSAEDKDLDRKSYFALEDTTRQLGDALEGSRKDLEAVQAALANKKHSLAFAHNQIRRLRRVSRENRRRNSQKIQKLKHTTKGEIMRADRRHLEEVLVLHKEAQLSTAEYSQQILTLQDENRDSQQKNVHEIRVLQEQLDVSATKRAEEVQSLQAELKATEEKYLQKLESLQDESRRDKQTVATLQKERTVVDGLTMKFHRTMSACVITGLVSLQFILIARNLKEIA